MVARRLGKRFVTGRAIYICTLERQGSSLEECGLQWQLLSALGWWDLGERRHKRGRGEPEPGDHPSLLSWVSFAQGNDQPGAA